MDRRYLEDALRQRTRFIKHDGGRFAQSLQIVGALDQDAGGTGAADAGKKAERDADQLMTRKVKAR